MHGLGNDFVVLDARAAALDLTPPRRRAIADRRLGVGCDQLIVLEPPTEGEADVFMRIYNPDGTEAQACGNATRCVASVVMDERKADEVTIQTIAGLLESQKAGLGANGLPVISVDMGLARLDWREIPVRDGLRHQSHAGRHGAAAGSRRHQHVGNPHATFFVDDLAAIPITELGPKLEHDPFFPERANVGVAQSIGREQVAAAVSGSAAPGSRSPAARAPARPVSPPAAAASSAARPTSLSSTARSPSSGCATATCSMTGGIALAYRGELDRSLLS